MCEKRNEEEKTKKKRLRDRQKEEKCEKTISDEENSH